MTVVQVALPIPLMHPLNYQSNFFPIKGSRVLVPFGKRTILGIVVSYRENIHFNCKKLKSIKKILDNKSLFSDSLWSLLLWSANYYHYPIGKVLFYALPTSLRQGKAVRFSPLLQWEVVSKQNESFNLNDYEGSIKQQHTAVSLQQADIYQDQIERYKLNKITLDTFKKKRLIQLLPVQEEIKNSYSNFHTYGKKVKLNTEQSAAISAINSQKRFTVWLLVGVHGSGKTEVYLNIIENILIQGKQILVLVPEISLTSKAIQSFMKRFNTPVDVIHSELNNNKQLSVWLRAKNGHSSIIIGTRSALFTPFAKLGLIIIDEEHDDSYKQRNGWLYHARNLAVFRAKKENIPIIMGTATPSIESLYNIKQGKYHRLDLTRCIKNTKPITQYLLDLKNQPLKYGIHKTLIQHIKKHLAGNNQVMLFLNRRGYSPILTCHDCRWIAECSRCERYYTLHYYQYQINCHHCNTQLPIPIQCSECGSTHLVPVGLGTEQLEEKIKQIFPNIPVTRIDKDTTQHKGALKKHLADIYKNEGRIFIGTQMLTKRYHFPYVTLVGLLNVDNALFSSNYRAIEKFAQLYIQISGKIRSGSQYSEVILQTHYPQHPLLLTLLKKGYNAFAEEILKERRDTFLPPYNNHIIIRSEEYHNQTRSIFLNKLRQYIEQHNMCDSKLWIAGPMPAIQSKKRGRFQWQLLLQHPSRSYLRQFLSDVLPKVMAYPESRAVKWNIDVDPIEN